MKLPASGVLSPGVAEALVVVGVYHEVLVVGLREPVHELLVPEGGHVNDYGGLLRSEVLPDLGVSLRVEVPEASLLQASSTDVAADVRLVEKSNAVESVDGDDPGIHPLPHGLSNLAVDGDSPVQVVPVGRVRVVHPVGLAPPAGVVVAVLRSRPGVQVNQSLQAELLHPGESPLEIEQGAGGVRHVHVGGGEGLPLLHVPVPVTHRDPHVADARQHQVLQVGLGDEAVPVSHHPLVVHRRVQLLCVGPLVHHLVLQLPHVDLLEEDRSDPRLEQQPTTKVDPSDEVIVTASSGPSMVTPSSSHGQS